ncbi:MAG: diacylglycerol kinase family lipid kinase [Bacteroidales bacterium]|nr:diacylglycerol kinase family lipid kinase [Bacteroidales bacterium]
MTSVLFIINPHSGKVRNKKIEEIAHEELDSSLFQVDFMYTRYAGHALELSRIGVEKGYDIIVAVGGDGTIHEVSQSLIHSKSALSVIPMGSGNGFARFFGIPSSVRKAIQVIAKGEKKVIDTVLCNNEYFVNVAGFGFDAKIGDVYDKSCSEERGGLNYVKLIVEEYLNYPLQKCRFKIDGEEVEKTFFIASVCNSNQYGLNAVIAPEADITDGKFELVLVKEMPVFDVIPITFRLFVNQFNNSRHVETLHLEEFTIVNTVPRLLHLDGEPRMMANDITFTIQKQSLNCIVPKQKKSIKSITKDIDEEILDIAQKVKDNHKKVIDKLMK